MLQVRAKGFSEVEAERLVSRVLKRLKGLRVLCILNDFVSVALNAGCDGVHIGQDDMPARKARDMLGQDMILGVSCRTPEQAADAEKAGADYIGIGPVFSSVTKPGGNLLEVRLAQGVQQAVRIPSFAIGGIHTGNLGELSAAGINRVAVCKALTGAGRTGVIREFKRILGEN